MRGVEPSTLRNARGHGALPQTWSQAGEAGGGAGRSDAPGDLRRKGGRAEAKGESAWCTRPSCSRSHGRHGFMRCSSFRRSPRCSRLRTASCRCADSARGATCCSTSGGSGCWRGCAVVGSSATTHRGGASQHRRLTLRHPGAGDSRAQGARGAVHPYAGHADRLGRADPRGSEITGPHRGNKIIAEGDHDRRAGVDREGEDVAAPAQGGGVFRHGGADDPRSASRRAPSTRSDEDRRVLRGGGRHAVDTLTSIIEPVMIVIWAESSAAVVAMYLPMFSSSPSCPQRALMI